MSAKELSNKIIRVRKFLMKTNKSQINYFRCLEILNRLERQMKAYGNKWNSEGWEMFIKRNVLDFMFLIPANNSQNKLIQELNKIVYES